MEEIINNVLSNFKNKEQFRKSAVFNSVVNQLARGVTPYQVIETLIERLEATTTAFIEYTERDTRPIEMPNGVVYKVKYNDDVIDGLISRNINKED